MRIPGEELKAEDERAEERGQESAHGDDADRFELLLGEDVEEEEHSGSSHPGKLRCKGLHLGHATARSLNAARRSSKDSACWCYFCKHIFWSGGMEDNERGAPAFCTLCGSRLLPGARDAGSYSSLAQMPDDAILSLMGREVAKNGGPDGIEKYSHPGVGLEELREHLAIKSSLQRKDAGAGRPRSSKFCDICGHGGTHIHCSRCPASFHKTCIILPANYPIPKEGWWCSGCMHEAVRTKEIDPLPLLPRQGKRTLPSVAQCCSSCGYPEIESLNCDACARWFCYGCMCVSHECVPPDQWACPECIGQEAYDANLSERIKASRERWTAGKMTAKERDGFSQLVYDLLCACAWSEWKLNVEALIADNRARLARDASYLPTMLPFQSLHYPLDKEDMMKISEAYAKLVETKAHRAYRTAETRIRPADDDEAASKDRPAAGPDDKREGKAGDDKGRAAVDTADDARGGDTLEGTGSPADSWQHRSATSAYSAHVSSRRGPAALRDETVAWRDCEEKDGEEADASPAAHEPRAGGAGEEVAHDTGCSEAWRLAGQQAPRCPALQGLQGLQGPQVSVPHVVCEDRQHMPPAAHERSSSDDEAAAAPAALPHNALPLKPHAAAGARAPGDGAAMGAGGQVGRAAPGLVLPEITMWKPELCAQGAGRGGGERLRIGYMSSDFVNHPTADLIIRALLLHNPAEFDTFCYSLAKNDNSTYRRTLEKEMGSSKFRLLPAKWSDRKCAEMIADDGIHILVNLNGHTAGDRNGICALRPAPLQVSVYVCVCVVCVVCVCVCVCLCVGAGGRRCLV